MASTSNQQDQPPDNNSIRIEPLDDKNIAKLKLLTRILFPNVCGPVIHEFLLFDNFHSAVAYYNNQCAGFVICEKDETYPHISVDFIGVLDKFQRKGIGRALLTYVNQKAVELKNVSFISMLVVEKSRRIRSFIENCGFTDYKTLHPGLFSYTKKVDVPEIIVKTVAETGIEAFKELNKNFVGVSFHDQFYTYVKNSPWLYYIASKNDVPIGSMSCEMRDEMDYKFLHIMHLGVSKCHEASKIRAQRALLNQAVQYAENQIEIERLTIYVNKEDTDTISLLEEEGFYLFIPHKSDPAHHATADLFYFKSTIDEVTKARITQEDEMIAWRAENMSITDITEPFLPELRQFDLDVIQPEHKDYVDSQEDVFKNVLDIPNLTCLAFYRKKLVGIISCVKDVNPDGSYAICMMRFGVNAEFSDSGIGKELVQRIVKVAENMENVKFMYTYVEKNDVIVCSFFESCGFEKRGFVPCRQCRDCDVCFYKKTDN